MPVLNRIPEGSLIVVCDSRQARFLTNAGSPIHPKLQMTSQIEAPAPDEDEEPDRPGRRFDGGSANADYHQRSAMEGPDLDKQHAAEFAAMIADRLSHRHRSEGFRHLVIAAPPEFLGLLRDKMSDEIAEIVLAEVPKRLTDATPEEIGQRLVEAW